MNYTKLLKIGVLCIISAICNTVIGHFIHNIAGVPLYLDTVFNAAMFFSAGLLPALVTGTLLSPVMFFLFCRIILGLSVELSLFRNVWVICIIVEILLIWAFRSRIKKREAVFFEKPSLQSFVGVAALLLVLAALSCLAVSVSGGIIDYALALLKAPRTFSPEDSFKLGLLRNNVPLLATAILSRIPINIVDRFIVIFGGYGASLVFRKWFGGREEFTTKRTYGTSSNKIE